VPATEADYGRPFKIWRVRITKNSRYEKRFYLGDMPIMLGGGAFIINGAERGVVSQVAAAPAWTYLRERRRARAAQLPRDPPGRPWIELNVPKKRRLVVRTTRR